MKFFHPKIEVQLVGGMGNQMLGYAAGKALETFLQIPLVFDVDGGFFSDVYDRQYALNWWQLEITPLRGIRSFNYFSNRAYQRVLSYSSDHAKKARAPLFLSEKLLLDIVEGDFSLRKEARTRGVYYNGVCRDPRVPNAIREALLKTFQPKQAPPDVAIGFKQQIERTENSVCVHVRLFKEIERLRGLSQAASSTPVQPLTYYLNAMSSFRKLFNKCSFFVFTEERGWVRENFTGLSDVTLVDMCSIQPENRECLEIWLMKHCKHFIITQSTFGWWGAWLSENNKKKVVIPEGFTL